MGRDDRQRTDPFIHDYYDNGITKTICTDINRDGMLQGPAIELYKEIQEQIPLLYLIASGGISLYKILRNWLKRVFRLSSSVKRFTRERYS